YVYLESVGMDGHRCLDLFEAAVKPGLQLRQRNMRDTAIVKNREGQAKLGSKLLQAHLSALGSRENKIGRLPNRGQVIHQGARPIKDDVANHKASVPLFELGAIDS